MSKADALRPDPTMIGNVAEPPFVRLPEPTVLFATRAQRFRDLTNGHELGPYLRFLADLSDCQTSIQDDLPEPNMPVAAVRAQARAHNMPPLDRSRFAADAAAGVTFERLIVLAAGADMPDSARAALDRVRAANTAVRDDMMRSVLIDSVPVEAFADHVFVAAALQVHFARLAARLDAKSLVPVGEGACPSCGAAPVASAVVGWEGAHGARFCTCSMCATQWHVVRVKCVLCASTKGIAYQDIKDGNGSVKAETCEVCRGYVKILHQHKDPALDPVADDVASLGLDILLREGGYRRGAINPFLLGY